LSSLRARGLTVERVYTGTYLSALEMPGCSLSVLPVEEARLALLDAPTTAAAWTSKGLIPAARGIVPAPASHEAAVPHSNDHFGNAVLQAARACADALSAAEHRLTDLDNQTGDGDLGISMARGADAIRALSPQEDAAATLASIAGALRRAIAGSSGPFYAVGILRAAALLSETTSVDAGACARAFRAAVDAISEMGGAKPGDRTMLDALYPAVEAFQAALDHGATASDAWIEAAQAAETGAQATAQMRPKLGRSSYLGDRALGVEDGGAVAVSIWIRALANAAR
jgi:dihydroxyacetone kinase